jgi:hypothetical protein
MGTSGPDFTGGQHSAQGQHKVYKAVMQSVLLYGSKTWNLSMAALARLEGFRICAAYHTTEKHKPQMELHHKWVYLCSNCENICRAKWFLNQSFKLVKLKFL